jgi:DNA-binding NarL/FixJ family response regulator
MADTALLDEVRQAAAAALEALATEDGYDEAEGKTRAAARTALDGGHSIAEIAAAQADGERMARERVGPQVLRAVERTAKKIRDATDEHEREVAKGVRLGLAARDIAARAGVSHATVTAVARRREQAQAAAQPAAASGPGEVVDAGEPAPESGAG